MTALGKHRGLTLMVVAWVITCGFVSVDSVLAVPDEKAITTMIQNVGRAMVSLPKTKDAKAVLKYFADDYTFIDDAAVGNRQAFESILRDIIENVPPEAALEITDNVQNIQVHVQNKWAWATYDETITLLLDKKPMNEDISKCTGIFRKHGEWWLYVHEHCSEADESKKD